MNHRVIEKQKRQLIKQLISTTGISYRSFEKELVAWHEAGHTLLHKLIGNDVFLYLSIEYQKKSLSNGRVVTLRIPRSQSTKADLIKEIYVLYGGRIGEYLYRFYEQDFSSGAEEDITKATTIILDMIKRFGMYPHLGILDLRQFEMKTILYEEAKKISIHLYEEALRIVTPYRAIMQELVDVLLKKGTIYHDELTTILQNLPSLEIEQGL